MKISRRASMAKRRIRPKAKFGFAFYDVAEFAAFLKRYAGDWLRKGRPKRRSQS
jgi:hypothetical protein